MTTRDRLFVSYAHEDRDLVRRFLQMLRRMSPPGERIWWDGKIAAGDRSPEEIQRELGRLIRACCSWSRTSPTPSLGSSARAAGR